MPDAIPEHSSAADALLIEQRGPVQWITLNRPDSLNALDAALINRLLDHFQQLSFDHSIRVVVLRGAGRAFCAGLDIKEAVHDDMSASATLNRQRRISEIVLRMRRCPQPIISLVQGAASGGGFALALASDIRIAGSSARMNAAFIRVGLSACDIGISYFLPRLVGVSVASELMLTGRFINAERALRTGLVSEVVADDALADTAQAYVDDMLASSPLGLRLTKQGLNLSVDAPCIEAAVALEDRQQVLCTANGDFKEGMAAFLERRRPLYSQT